MLHIHVDHIDSNHYLIAIATEFGQIKVFEVRNYHRHRHHAQPQTRSEFREFLSGNISSNICKIQLYLTHQKEEEPEEELAEARAVTETEIFEPASQKRSLLEEPMT